MKMQQNKSVLLILNNGVAYFPLLRGPL